MGLYYLQSRYYNPTIGRFLNADALVATGQGVLGNNMFAYCLNNPVGNSDSSGQFSASCSRVSFGDGSGGVRCYAMGHAVNLCIYNNSIYIDAYMTFSGNLNVEYLIAGIEMYWEGRYTYGQYEFNVFITVHQGESSRGSTIKVRTRDSYGRSYAMLWNARWSYDKSSTVTIFGDYYESIGYNWTMAHEFGHCLGVLDYYTNENNPGFDRNFDSIMNLPGHHATASDIVKVILAFQYNVVQRWYCVGGL